MVLVGKDYIHHILGCAPDSLSPVILDRRRLSTHRPPFFSRHYLLFCTALKPKSSLVLAVPSGRVLALASLLAIVTDCSIEDDTAAAVPVRGLDCEVRRYC